MNSSDSLLIAEIDDLIELLRLRVLRFRHQLEIAEARVPRWNQLVQQFWQAGLIPQAAILGRVIETRPYAPIEGGHSSGQVVQASMLIPGGVAVLLWDTEDFVLQSEIPDEPESHAWAHHVPFDRYGFSTVTNTGSAANVVFTTKFSEMFAVSPMSCRSTGAAVLAAVSVIVP